MIRLLIIVPYPELMEKICTTLETPAYKERIDATIQLVTVDKVDQIIADGYDLIVARGFTAKTLSRSQGIPTIPLPISSYDILRAVAECKTRCCPPPKKICCIGPHEDFHAISSIGTLLDVPLEVIICDHPKDIDRSVQQAVEDGCDAIVGGYSAFLSAQKQGIPSVFISTGAEAICQVFDEAIRITEVTQARQLRNEMYRTVIQFSQEAILYVDRNGRIIIENPAALALTNEKCLKARKLSETLPYMYASFRKVIETGQEIMGEIHKQNDQRISINYTPIFVKGNAGGVLIFFQDITRIQKLEATIRKNLSDKGLRAKYHFEDVIHESAIMDLTIERARSYAGTSSNIMLLGESGTGKELFAQSIHNCSSRKDGPFVAINCAALPENLLESELFGYVQGAFTGTNKGGKIGLFEVAHGGTLFLDEISEVSLNLQSKLLRVLQEREIRRIGDDRVISIDVRIICATNRNLKQLVTEGVFRQDLMYRLDVLRVFLPPLRKRQNDALIIFRDMMTSYFSGAGLPIPELTPESEKILLSYPFYGNVRELRNIVERVSVLHPSETPITAEELNLAISPEDIQMDQDPHIPELPREPEPDSEYIRIQAALQKCNGNQSKAARELGIDRSTLWRKLKKYKQD